MLTLSWDPPTQPNGIIIEYVLFVDGEVRFSGSETSATVDNLLPSTSYSFLVQACTSVGCSNSSESYNTTLPDKPAGFSPPSVIPLTPTALKITWEEPREPNGDILLYELQQVSGDNFTVLFTGIGFTYTLRGLSPNTLYSFRVLVTNAGGTTVSNVTSNRTLEDAPDGLAPPTLTVLNATAINVTWLEPTQPNGVITEYILSRNESEVFQNLELFYTDTGLRPYTIYSYFVQACTSGNCSASTLSHVRTDEGVPEGFVPPTITSVTSASFSLTINGVLEPNGVVHYVITVTGTFASSLLEETREVYSETHIGMVDVMDLLPFSNYTIMLTASNTAGSLTGISMMVTTEPAG